MTLSLLKMKTTKKEERPFWVIWNIWRIPISLWQQKILYKIAVGWKESFWKFCLNLILSHLFPQQFLQIYPLLEEQQNIPELWGLSRSVYPNLILILSWFCLHFIHIHYTGCPTNMMTCRIRTIIGIKLFSKKNLYNY